MSLFGKLVKTAVNLVVLPVEVAKDVVTAFPDACELNKNSVGERTRRALEKLKEESDDQ